MGFIKDIATELIDGYRDGGGAKRLDIMQRDLNGMKLSVLRKMVHYFYHREKPPVLIDHNDRHFLYKLTAWAIVERSKILAEKDQQEALIRNRKAFIEKGPLSDDQLASSQTVGNSKKRRKEREMENRMATEKKVVKEKKADKGSKGGELKVLGKSFPENHKFKLKENAEHHKNFKKRGPLRIAALIFKIGKTFEEALVAYKKELQTGSLKGTRKEKEYEKYSKKNVRGALRRLVRSNLLEGTPGTIPAPKKLSKEVLTKGKVTIKGKAKEEPKVKTAVKKAVKKKVEDDEDDEEDEEEPKATVKKVVKAVKKPVKVEDDEDDDDDEEESDDKDDSDEDEDEDK